MTDVSAFDEAPTASNAQIDSLLEKAEELITLEVQLADLKALTDTLSARANELKTKTIPDKMAEIGLSEFATPAGNKLKIEDFVAGAMPKEPLQREAAIKELEAWGAESVIRNEVLMVFEKSQHNEAMALVDDIRAKGFAVEVTSGVHPQTYLKIIRERLAGGEAVDLEKMGVFAGRKTKVTLAKDKAKKS